MVHPTSERKEALRINVYLLDVFVAGHQESLVPENPQSSSSERVLVHVACMHNERTSSVS